MRFLERIHMSSKPVWILLDLVLCFSMTGCGARPLVKTHLKVVGPWCAPNHRVQIGERVVGHVHDGNKWKLFLVDDAGKEYDPDKLADQIWSYLERTGDAKKIEEAFSKEAYQSNITVVSVNPLIVILGTYQDASWLKQNREFAHKRWFWHSQVSSLGEPPFREGLQWFSPELKQKPTNLAFSQGGVAEIPLADGKLKLIREGDRCKTTRE
jgi:hypothetical protein